MSARIAISNIAWQAAEETAIADLLAKQGIAGVEVAPTKLWPAPLEATPAELDAYKAFWQQRGIAIVALQALLYGRPDLKLFASAANRAETLQYLQGIVAIAARLGARLLVFGAPKSRQRGSLSVAEATDIACEFFQKLGETAWQRGCQICIEPNPKVYQCDFVTNACEGLALVERANSPGFGLHLDAAALTLGGDIGSEAAEKNNLGDLQSAIARISHFHISEPQLGPVGANESAPPTVPHERLSQLLQAANYSGWRSIEMRPQDPHDNRAAVKRALQFALGRYACQTTAP